MHYDVLDTAAILLFVNHPLKINSLTNTHFVCGTKVTAAINNLMLTS